MDGSVHDFFMNVIKAGLLLKSRTPRAVGDLAELGWTTQIEVI